MVELMSNRSHSFISSQHQLVRELILVELMSNRSHSFFFFQYLLMKELILVEPMSNRSKNFCFFCCLFYVESFHIMVNSVTSCTTSTYLDTVLPTIAGSWIACCSRTAQCLTLPYPRTAQVLSLSCCWNAQGLNLSCLRARTNRV